MAPSLFQTKWNVSVIIDVFLFLLFGSFVGTAIWNPKYKKMFWECLKGNATSNSTQGSFNDFEFVPWHIAQWSHADAVIFYVIPALLAFFLYVQTSTFFVASFFCCNDDASELDIAINNANNIMNSVDRYGRFNHDWRQRDQSLELVNAQTINEKLQLHQARKLKSRINILSNLDTWLSMVLSSIGWFIVGVSTAVVTGYITHEGPGCTLSFESYSPSSNDFIVSLGIAIGILCVGLGLFIQPWIHVWFQFKCHPFLSKDRQESDTIAETDVTITPHNWFISPVSFTFQGFILAILVHMELFEAFKNHAAILDGVCGTFSKRRQAMTGTWITLILYFVFPMTSAVFHKMIFSKRSYKHRQSNMIFLFVGACIQIAGYMYVCIKLDPFVNEMYMNLKNNCYPIPSRGKDTYIVLEARGLVALCAIQICIFICELLYLILWIRVPTTVKGIFDDTNRVSMDIETGQDQPIPTNPPSSTSQHPSVPIVIMVQPQYNSNSNSNIECRYCHEGIDQAKGQLISPCACSGSIKYVHEYCLAKWRVSKSMYETRCPECHQLYEQKNGRIQLPPIPMCIDKKPKKPNKSKKSKKSKSKKSKKSKKQKGSTSCSSSSSETFTKSSTSNDL